MLRAGGPEIGNDPAWSSVTSLIPRRARLRCKRGNRKVSVQLTKRLITLFYIWGTRGRRKKEGLCFWILPNWSALMNISFNVTNVSWNATWWWWFGQRFHHPLTLATRQIRVLRNSFYLFLLVCVLFNAPHLFYYWCVPCGQWWRHQLPWRRTFPHASYWFCAKEAKTFPVVSGHLILLQLHCARKQVILAFNLDTSA